MYLKEHKNSTTQQCKIQKLPGMQSKLQLNNGWGKKSTDRDTPAMIQTTEWSSTLKQLLLMYSRCQKKNGGKHEPVKENHGGY